MKNIKDYITVDQEILNGQPVFKGTRVPIETMFLHLEKGVSIDEFLENFPSVEKEQAVAVLGFAEKLLTSTLLNKPREGWEKVFKEMAQNGDDKLLMDEILLAFEESENEENLIEIEKVFNRKKK